MKPLDIYYDWCNGKRDGFSDEEINLIIRDCKRILDACPMDKTLRLFRSEIVVALQTVEGFKEARKH